MENANPDKRMAPAAERNKDVILDVLKEIVSSEWHVLEIASGSGQHAVHFADTVPDGTWQPTDIAPENLASIAAWTRESAAANVPPPLSLDVTISGWSVDPCPDAIVCINMIHIAPWAACLGLLEGGGRLLPEGGILFLYGPFQVGGRHTAPTNESFDQSLRAQNADWGVRNLDDVALEARRHGLHLVKTVKMPANNLSVIFRKTAMVNLED